MLTNLLVIPFRKLARSPLFSIINITGLVLGLSSSLFVFLWVHDESSIDRFHKDGKRIFKVMVNTNWGEVQTFKNTPNALGTLLEKEVPGMERVLRMTDWDFPELFVVAGHAEKELKGR